MSTDSNDRLAARMAELSHQVEGIKRDNDRRQDEARITQYGNQLTQQIAAAESEISTHEAAIASAMDAQDAAAMVSAQRRMAEAVARRGRAEADLDRHKAARQQYEREMAEERAAGSAPARPAPQPQPAPKKDTTNLDAWTARNKDWYGVNVDMTEKLREIDTNIRKAGALKVGSKEYFEAIDMQMGRAFPDVLSGRASTNPSTSGNPASASGTRASGTIPAGVLATWRKMGINVDDPQVLKRMVGHQQTAVAKGILPEARMYGDIIT